MNAVGELGELIIKYQTIIEIALLSIFGIMILFFIIRAFVRAQKSKNVLKDISHAVDNINETVSEIKEKQDCITADIRQKSRSPVVGLSTGQPPNCEASKRIMQECDKIDNYMAELAERINVKEDHIAKLEQIKCNEISSDLVINELLDKREKHAKDLSNEKVAEEAVEETFTDAETDLDLSLEPESCESKSEDETVADVKTEEVKDEEKVIDDVAAIESKNDGETSEILGENLYEFDAEHIDDEMWKDDIVNKESETCRPELHFDDIEIKTEVDEPKVKVREPKLEEIQLRTLEPKAFAEAEIENNQTNSDEDMPLQTVEEIIAKCSASENQETPDVKPQRTFDVKPERETDSRFVENWDAKKSPSYTFERPKAEDMEEEYIRQQELLRQRAMMKRAAEAEALNKERVYRKEATQPSSNVSTSYGQEMRAVNFDSKNGQANPVYRNAEEEAIVAQGAKRFDFTMEIPKLDENAMGTDRKKAAADFLKSFENTMKDDRVRTSDAVRPTYASQETRPVDKVAPVEPSRPEPISEQPVEKENPFVAAFNEVAENRSNQAEEPKANSYEEPERFVEREVPPKKYFSRTCATDKFGNSYTEEELKNQIN